ncbi:MAG: folylpolyglutamate synthase/dihydrofolate synthase family protein [Thermodesulfobacteriota bacterium]|nr:folylpolyglutamate synthase/dihydrofolate synthase family protein [Thermodesulfobacteriota bacterium]
MARQSEYQRLIHEMYNLRRFGIKLELSTMQRMLDGLGRPHTRYETIHIAGTNGKGSIATTLATILHSAGYKTGLYTSPHLVTFNERIQINNRPVSNAAVVRACKAVRGLSGDGREPTFFEYTTAMAFYLFAELGVDIAVIETGMGGRFDATNMITPCLSVISNISVEHRMYLGNTLGEIAGEKAGIIKPGVPVVTGARQKPVLDVIKKVAKKQAAPLYRLGGEFRVRRHGDGTFSYHGLSHRWDRLRTVLAGGFQVDNAALVLAGCELLMASGKPLSEATVRKGLASTRWPARLEIVSDSPTVLIDGAHNLQAAKHLAVFLSEQMAGRKITLVAGILDDKPYRAMLRAIVPLCDRVILTRAQIGRAIAPEILEREARNLGATRTHVIDRVDKALAFALAHTPKKSGAICVAGSLYVAGEARHAIKQKGEMQPAI